MRNQEVGEFGRCGGGGGGRSWVERGGGWGVVEALRERRAVVEVRRCEGELRKGRFFGGVASVKPAAGSGGGRGSGGGGCFSGFSNGEGDVWR